MTDMPQETPRPNLRVRYLLISRFNLFNLNGYRERAGIVGEKYYDWCKYRVGLFKRYTLPSVLNQDIANFSWIIGFDPELNAPIEGLLAELAQHTQIKPLFIDMRREPDTPFHIHACRTVTRRFAYVCTVNLDTDDALAGDFMRLVRRSVRRLEPEAMERVTRLNFPFVAQLSGGVFRVSVHESSNFVVLVSPNPRPFSVDEARIPRREFRHIFTKQPMATSIIHGGNVFNREKTSRPVMADTSALAERFGFQL